MCAIFGFVNYGNKISYGKLKKLVRELSITCEVRGTDATGISYIKNDKVKVFKQPKPAHELNLYFPKDTKILIGHTRYTTQGSEKFNQNNHPFKSKLNGFSLAHNGIIYNDKSLRTQYQLSTTNIETDSYIAVQLLDCYNQLDFNSIKFMAENLQGSIAISVLNNDNTLYLIKGSNPIYLIHFKLLGLYLYSSTKEIMLETLENSKFNYPYDIIQLNQGDILKINSNGCITKDYFNPISDFYDYNINTLNDYFNYYELDDLLQICNCFGITEDDVYQLLDYGFDIDEIEYIIQDKSLL